MRIVDYVNALPDAYKKTPDSNNYKLLSLEQSLVEGFRGDIKAVDATLDIYSATGKTLDLYGSIYCQARGSMTDEQYRYIILQRAMRCLVGGDANSIIKALAVVFKVDASEFGLVDTENPCEVEVTNLPYSVLQNAGLTTIQVYQVIQSMLPAGVRLAPLELSGTFEFAATADEQSDTAGFGDIDQTIGGYLGYLASDNNNIEIPN